MKTSIVVCAAVLSSLAGSGWADEVRTESVRFEKGASSASIQGSLKGYETVQYTLGARQEQRMTVDMTTDNGAAYFNIFEPGKKPGEDGAMFIGSTEGLSFSGSLPASGDFMIQVYQMRSAARRDEIAEYTLEIEIVDGSEARDFDAKVPGTDFHATGQLPCARYEGQPMSQCDFGVVRRSNGDADLTIFWPGDGSRVIVFEDGAPVSSDADEELTANQEAGLHMVRIGTERFEIVEAIIFGG